MGGCLGRGLLWDPDSWLPPVLSPDLVDVGDHLVLVECHVFLLAILAHHSSRLQKLTDENLCTEAEMLPLKVIHSRLLQILKKWVQCMM